MFPKNVRLILENNFLISDKLITVFITSLMLFNIVPWLLITVSVLCFKIILLKNVISFVLFVIKSLVKTNR